MLRATSLTAIAILFGSANLFANDFLDPIFATPIRSSPGTYVPPGSTLNAPVITPIGTKHGRTLFDVTPMGHDAHSRITSHPEHYLCATRESTLWLTADFLYWATQGPTAPPLVQNGPLILPPALAPFVTVPATDTLLGGERMLNGMRPGVRVTGGVFLDAAKEWALGYSAAFLGSRSERLTGGSDGTNIVNLPQFNTFLGTPFETPLYVGYPGLTRGTVAAAVQSSFFTGSGQLRRVAQSGTGNRFDLIAGYRYAHLGDSIARSFDVVSAVIPGQFSPRFQGEESTRTRNAFNGGELGFQFQGRMGRFIFDWQSTIALGATSTEIDRSYTRSYIAGGPLSALLGVPLPPVGIPLIQTGGLVKRSEFAVMPQVGVKLGWEPIDHVRLTAGYDFLYWSRVRRAPELFTGNDVVTDFWAQGLSLGIDFRY
jgi:hypothetical protein